MGWGRGRSFPQESYPGNVWFAMSSLAEHRTTYTIKLVVYSQVASISCQCGFVSVICGLEHGLTRQIVVDSIFDCQERFPMVN